MLWRSLPPFCGFSRAYRSNSLKHSSLYEAFLPLLSPVLLFVLSTTWVVYSPSNVLELQPRTFYLMVGTAFANVTVSVCFTLNLFGRYCMWFMCKCHLSCSVSWLCVRWVTHVARRWAGSCCPWRWWCYSPCPGWSPTRLYCCICGQPLLY